MNRDDKVILTRLEEKIINVHDDVIEIKNKIIKIKGCIDEHNREIAVTQTKLDNHLTSHETSRNWMMWIPSFVAVIVAILALAIKVGG